MKKAISIMIILVFLFQLAGCGGLDSAKDTAGKIGKQAAEKAESIAGDVADGISNAWNAASTAVSQLSFPDFKKGFETAASYFGTTVVSLGGQNYVDRVADAINALQQRLTNRISSNGPVASQAGFAAEEWHAGTYNIDAVASGKNVSANTPKSNGLGSADIQVGDVEASVKYYQDYQASAKQQAKDFFDRYGEYRSKSNSPKELSEWLADNGINKETDADLYYSIYQDQLRIIPSDQLDDAIEHLKRAIAKESSKDSANRHYVAEKDLETLNNLVDRLKTADGIESIPLSKDEAEALVKAARDGDLDEQFLKKNVTLNESIEGTYIAKQAIKSGATAAIIEAAIVLGPEIYEIIKLGIENGELDGDLLKDAGIDGLTAAGDGFLKGSISNALVIFCQAGKLGESFIDASPEIVGTLTVLVIDAVKYGIMLGSGKMTTVQYLDAMAEEVFVSAGALGTAALMAMLFPGATLAIMLGSFVGGLVISAGYTTGKTFVLAWIAESDIDLLVPIQETANAIKNLAATLSIKVTDAIAGMKKVKDNTYDKVTIMVYNLTGRT